VLVVRGEPIPTRAGKSVTGHTPLVLGKKD
jgi:hypothetical protein